MLTCAQVVEAFNYGLNIPGLSPTHSFQIKYHYTSPTPWETSTWSLRPLGRTINTFALLYHTLSIRVTGMCVFFPICKGGLFKDTKFRNPPKYTRQTSKQLLVIIAIKSQMLNTIQTGLLERFQQNTAWWKPSLALKLVYTLFEVGNCNFTQHQQIDHTYTK